MLLLSSATAGAAEGGASDADEARAYHEKAKAAFALSHYAQAAEFFEKAFELKSDPALLYNAAQSHRLAGNKQRALTLYQNYLRVYGRDERRPQIELRIEELKKAIEKDRTEVPVPPPAGLAAGDVRRRARRAKAGASTPPNLRAAEPAKPLPPAPPRRRRRLRPRRSRSRRCRPRRRRPRRSRLTSSTAVVPDPADPVEQLGRDLRK